MQCCCCNPLPLVAASFVLTIAEVTTPMVLPPKREARFLQPLLAKINALAFSRLLPRWQSQRCLRTSMRSCAGAKMTRDALCAITFCYPILIVSSWSSACLPEHLPHLSIYLSVYLSINQSSNQSINQSSNQSINHVCLFNTVDARWIQRQTTQNRPCH